MLLKKRTNESSRYAMRECAWCSCTINECVNDRVVTMLRFSVFPSGKHLYYCVCLLSCDLRTRIHDVCGCLILVSFADHATESRGPKQVLRRHFTRPQSREGRHGARESGSDVTTTATAAATCTITRCEWSHAVTAGKEAAGIRSAGGGGGQSTNQFTAQTVTASAGKNATQSRSDVTAA